jgi:uncharacterized protein (TIGR00251 family)
LQHDAFEGGNGGARPFRCPGRDSNPQCRRRTDFKSADFASLSTRAGWSILFAVHADVSVRLTPRAAKDAVVVRADGTLAVRVTAPPVDGRANEALCRVLARRAGVGRTAVSVVRGQRARDKVVRVEGLDAAGLRERLAS